MAPLPAAGASSDPWFWSHYDGVPKILLSMVPAECLANGRRIVDFGCGDGITSLGIASRVQASVNGVDVHKSYLHLPDLAEKNMALKDLPANLSFTQTELGKGLPHPDASVDLIYSWSVFEHVSDVKGVLAEMGRIAKPGATLFIQIEPLFFGPFGSHLQRLVDEPWAHLLYSEEEFLGKAAAASDHVPESDQDSLYRMNSFDDVKRYLLAEYRSLNRITAPELTALISGSGFGISTTKLIPAEGFAPDKRLLEKYPEELLLTNQIVVVATKL